MHGGGVIPWGPRSQELPVGGAGWTRKAAAGSALGEAVERWQAYALPADRSIEASFAAWPLPEPAIPPHRWVLFHPEQHAQPGFPFAPFTPETVCRWVCCRQALTGEPWWVPEEMVFLFNRPGTGHQLCPGLSTGLSCGKAGDPVLLRGLQEVIERDALMGMWWGNYLLEEWHSETLWQLLGARAAQRLQRPHLRYRFYRLLSPFSAHVTLVTLEGEDKEGYCFSVGSACRETRLASWRKAVLEAVQGWHYVRLLKPQYQSKLQIPTDFAEHAVYYTLYPEQLADTPFQHPLQAHEEQQAAEESVPALVERLGAERPVLFRNLTPPALAQEFGDWIVLRVVVPGLQPMHGDHRLPHLGGQLWKPHGLQAWRTMPPHPFP
jgi:ribosomal protein S12 methylthiotransferase accessory factor